MNNTILIADDDAMCRFIIKNFLQPFNCTIHEFEHGFTLLSWLHKEANGRIALLLDLDMPLMDGYEFLHIWEKEKDNYPNVQLSVIVVSAADFSVIQERQLENCIDAFIGKPVEGGILVSTISRCLQQPMDKEPRL
jgi:CheY-like chemotaxis protein